MARLIGFVVIALVLLGTVTIGLYYFQTKQNSQSSTNSSTSTNTSASTFGSKVRTTVSNSYTPRLTCSPSKALQIDSLRVALIKPIFTSSAYQTGLVPVIVREGKANLVTMNTAFYRFYSLHAGNKTVTQDLNLLDVSTLDSWGISSNFFDFLTSNQTRACGLILGKNLVIVDDTELSTNKSSLSGINVVILPFEEYVTQSEYNSLWAFVASGGKLISLSGDSFYALVKYNPQSQHVALVAGHGWQFNGSLAWQSTINPFFENNTNWIGSNFCCFHGSFNGIALNAANSLGSELLQMFGSNIWKGYTPTEDNGISNFTNTQLIGSAVEYNYTIGPYVHYYRKGAVIDATIFLSTIIQIDPSAQYFVIDSITY